MSSICASAVRWRCMRRSWLMEAVKVDLESSYDAVCCGCLSTPRNREMGAYGSGGMAFKFQRLVRLERLTSISMCVCSLRLWSPMRVEDKVDTDGIGTGRVVPHGCPYRYPKGMLAGSEDILEYAVDSVCECPRHIVGSDECARLRESVRTRHS
ncbi:hypothetical protein GLAREA_07850 [Glarea lozoyensis ATCC 20868]|uniref:Uncharacterized protein n=1 Tax=Glarea lozoyensis (strain ATCC 20868 / MF5171) TaxID=1116229 RepID=S3DKY4_GLAL2|nr:uncharacterized protein GLAREA_07850 [Glarea lozoyensis ATCC 20868]EPE32716.1 hypothetical protein GLAREA_07850 [Glarea lozoyensis ATCC 20868]